MKINSGIFRQRIGNLIEKEICKKYNLYYNLKQKKFGYYDAYNKQTLYEIKSSSINYNTFIIRKFNQKRLLNAYGEYIFISYKLINKDCNLSVISDIKIKNIYFIKASDLDLILKK